MRNPGGNARKIDRTDVFVPPAVVVHLAVAAVHTLLAIITEIIVQGLAPAPILAVAVVVRVRVQLQEPH